MKRLGMIALAGAALAAGSAARAESRANVAQLVSECHAALEKQGRRNAAWIRTVCSCPMIDPEISSYVAKSNPSVSPWVPRVVAACGGGVPVQVGNAKAPARAAVEAPKRKASVPAGGDAASAAVTAAFAPGAGAASVPASAGGSVAAKVADQVFAACKESTAPAKAAQVCGCARKAALAIAPEYFTGGFDAASFGKFQEGLKPSMVACIMAAQK
jgi:hypothetical protein